MGGEFTDFFFSFMHVSIFQALSNDPALLILSGKVVGFIIYLFNIFIYLFGCTRVLAVACETQFPD